MAREFARKFYNSKEWKKCRRSFISIRQSTDGGMCEHCQKELGYIVDHITELTPENINDPDIILNHDNLQYLCLECHNTKTFGRQKEQRYVFDDNGMIQPRLPPY